MYHTLGASFAQCHNIFHGWADANRLQVCRHSRPDAVWFAAHKDSISRADMQPFKQAENCPRCPRLGTIVTAYNAVQMDAAFIQRSHNSVVVRSDKTYLRAERTKHS